MSAVLDHFPEGGTRKLALICLADYADDGGGTCYPSIRTIARRCCCSESQARRHVHALIESGYVNVEPGTEQGGSGSRRYQINLDKLTPCTDATPGTHARGSTHARGPLAPMRETPSTHDTRSVINRQLTVSAKRKRSAIASDEFCAFWNAYPKKRDRRKAEKAWNALNPDGEVIQSMLRALAAWKASPDWQRDGGQFIPHPATWINGRRWEDELHAEPKRERKVAL